tara:strand:+ start:291 stop:920 length:630 start_codon:yes stop_codon:yes gene_type:complete
MEYTPTTFFILENEDLGWWWVGKSKIKLNEDGYPSCRSMSQGDLINNLSNKYNYLNPYLHLHMIKGNIAYGLETWISQLEYEISRKSEKCEKLEELLMTGWALDDDKVYSTIHVLHVWNDTKKVDVKEIYTNLKKKWGTPDDLKVLRSSYKLDTCLNCVKDTNKERYEKSKIDPQYLYECARQKVLQRMKKTGKLPKRSTLEKYNIQLG